MALFDFFSKKVTQDDFAQLVQRELQKTGVTGNATYDPTAFSLFFEQAEGALLTVNLGNVYQRYNAGNKAERQVQLDNFVKSIHEGMTDVSANYATVKKHLMPVVRSVYVDSLAQMQSPDWTPEKAQEQLIVVSKPLCADLAIGIGIDTENSIRRASPEQLAQWGVSFEQALQDAMINLSARSQDQWRELQPGTFVSQFQDDYDASRLLLPASFLHLKVKGKHVALVPNRNTMLVTGSDDAAGQAVIQDYGLQVLNKQAGHTSMQTIAYDGNAWHPIQIEGDTGFMLHKISLELLRADYSEQQHALVQFQEKTNSEFFIAEFSSIQLDETSGPMSYAVLTKGVATLLPETDLVTLLELTPDGASVANSLLIRRVDLQAEIGAAFEPIEMAPRRYRVRDYPSDESIERLRGKDLGKV
jgi:uncharacterized protein YtpQ (UPF0354 family)